MVRYTLLRALMFFGVMALLYLLGLRDRDEQVPLLVLSALISMVLSYFVLARFREESTQRIAQAVQRRAQVKQGNAARSDEAAEDAEDEQGPEQYR